MNVNQSDTATRKQTISQVLLIIGLSLLLLGCGEKVLTPIGTDGRILAFGDSLTDGVGAAPQESYPSVLSELTGLTVINAGVSGETTGEGLLRLPKVLETSRADLLILIEGGNDILRNIPAPKIQSNLDAMIQLAKSQGIPVVPIGIPEKRLFASAAPFYQSVADAHNVVYDGKLMPKLLHTPGLKSDPIHLNAKGYRKMAEGVYTLLADNGAL